VLAREGVEVLGDARTARGTVGVGGASGADGEAGTSPDWASACKATTHLGVRYRGCCKGVEGGVDEVEGYADSNGDHSTGLGASEASGSRDQLAGAYSNVVVGDEKGFGGEH